MRGRGEEAAALIMRVCRRCQYDLSMLDDASICPECGCVQKDYMKPFLSGGEQLALGLMAGSFVVCTVGVVVGSLAWFRWPIWFSTICFAGSYLSLLIPVHILGRASNDLGPRWRPMLITLICAFPLFLLWLFLIALLLALFS